MNELRPYLRLLAEYRIRLALGAVLMLATVAAGIGLLALSGWFITATGVTALLLAAGVQARLEVFLPGAGIRFFALTRTAARYFERVHNHDAVLRLLADLRTRVFARLTPLDPAALARFRGAIVLNRLTADIDALDALYLRCLAPPLVGLLGIIGVGGLIAVFAPAAGVTIAAALLLGAGVVVAIAANRGVVIGERITERLEQMRSATVDLVRGLAELRAFGALQRQQARIDVLDRAQVRDQVRAARIAAAGEAGMGVAVHLGVALALVLGVSLHAREALDGPIIALMGLAVLALVEGLAPIPAGFLQLGRARAAARRLNAQVATAATVTDPLHPQPLPPTRELRLDRITVRHGRVGEPALQDVSLTVAEGERVAIVGPSGCGKSTLANLIARLLDPDRGDIRLGGICLRELALADLHGQIGYLTQRTEIFADTIAANLRIARPGATAEELWQALERAGLAEFVDRLDAGADTWVGENGVHLSGGQARRLALARVILRDAPIALLDEPLAGLDSATAARVGRNLDQWLSGRSAVLLAHEAGALPRVDRVIRMPEGRV